jgi:hypothetical protein
MCRSKALEEIEDCRNSIIHYTQNEGFPSDLSSGDQGAKERSRRYNKWRDMVKYSKSWGTVEEVMAMIEEGDQGVALRARVKNVREDEMVMRVLRGL